ncbi:MAG: YqiA/YcfP family alpha/beta fold hydrolase [Leptolyngbyaceae bacterium]|nr:YqiA/YcfP family alpha/beta fold hydrolase [Leptolyngbyaceae bacterium]
MKYIYLHGLASGPQSRKAQDLRDRFQQIGHRLHIPDLNQGNFTQLTLSRQIQQVKTDYLADDQPVTIIGSSLGGLTAAWLGQDCPQVDQLILLAPAFEFLARWRSLLPSHQWQQWQQTGSMDLYHYAQQKMVPLAYGFVTDLEQYDGSNLNRPVSTLMIHGTADEVVPWQVSRNYAMGRSHVQLLPVNSDHTLGDQLDAIWGAIAEIKGFHHP